MIGYGVHPPWNEGCVVVAHDLALAIQDHADVSVISIIDPYRNFVKERLEQKEMDHLVIDYMDSSFFFKVFRCRGEYTLLNQIFDIARTYSSLKSLDSQHGVDIIHVFNVSHLMISMLTKFFLRKAVVVHVLGATSLGDILSESLVDAYVCTSKSIYSYLISLGLPLKKVHLIPPAINCELYKPLVHNEVGTRARNSPFNITYFGNLHSERFPIEIITEIQQLSKSRKDLRLLIYCPDTLSNRENARRLEALLSRSNIKHSMEVSNLNQADKILAYNMSDILIFPFTKEVDGYDKSVTISDSIKAMDPPLTLLESMACSKIVIASRTLSIPNVIKHNKNGFLTDPEDFEGFRDTLENVVDNFHELQHIGENARRTIQKHFSSKEAYEKLIDVYKSVLK